jgi:phosphatidylglycerophosphate synthase
MRRETDATDGPMARLIDRKISWRISYLLASTRITPNVVTEMNTALGLLAAAMVASPGYWWRMMGTLLFLGSTVLDGVDGELAHLKQETESGGRLV